MILVYVALRGNKRKVIHNPDTFFPEGCSFPNLVLNLIFVQMRKSLFFLILLLFAYPLLLQAQNFHAGAFAGVSSSQVSGDNLAGFDKAGLYAGGFVNTPLSEKWNIQMEISYIQKGSRPTDADREYNPYMVYPTLNYAEVPIVFIYKATPKINIEAGPEFGVLVYSREEDSFTETEIQRPYSDFDFSFAVGVDYFLSAKWSVNSRVSNSLIPIRKHASGQTYGLNRGQYNSVLAFTIRYHF